MFNVTVGGAEKNCIRSNQCDEAGPVKKKNTYTSGQLGEVRCSM